MVRRGGGSGKCGVRFDFTRKDSGVMRRASSKGSLKVYITWMRRK